MKKHSTTIVFIFTLFLLSCNKENVWTHIGTGLAFGEFQVSSPIPFNDATIAILKIDPTVYDFHLLTISEQKHEPLSMPEWCERYDLLGAINAGMYQEDMSSNVGFLKNFDHYNNRHINSSYHSLAAFNPIDSTAAPFYIFDIDDYPADSVLAHYNSVVQNLRLIKRPGENRWAEADKRWPEAAIGQDKTGNVLFMYCRAPLTMTEFNEALLSLPIDIVCAMHAEGGQPAALHFSIHNHSKSFVGTSETKFGTDGSVLNGAPVPNIIGFSRKK